MIVLTQQQEDNAHVGAHGSYIKLSPSLGLKVIHSVKYKSRAKAYRCRAWREARLEAELLDIAFESGVVPRCYGATLVKVKSGFQVGVLMQHLGSTTLSNSKFYDEFDVQEDINNKLEELGIYHGDLHEDNIMVYRGKFYAIDFSPNCVSIDE